VRNLSRREKRVVRETIQLAGSMANSGDWRKAVFELNRVLRTHPGVLQDTILQGASPWKSQGTTAVSTPSGKPSAMLSAATPR